MIEATDRYEVDEIRRQVRIFGFVELPSPVPSGLLASMQQEADQCETRALRAEQTVGLAYRARIASLPPTACRFLSSAPLIGLLSSVFDSCFEMTPERSCLTLYREGDKLGSHLDRPAEDCRVTIILCLRADSPSAGSPQTGLRLQVYGMDSKPSDVPQQTVKTRVGAIVVGYGSRFWHERPMLQHGERVTSVTGCYRCLAPADC